MKKIRNSDFIVTLPDEVAGLELNGGDSVTMRIYTVNADNFYQFSYAGGLVPDTQKVDASMMATMESGVVQQLTIAHIADATMPDGFLDIAMEVSTDYYWIKSQYESAQEQIAQLRRDLEEEEEVREASDDAINNRIDFIDDEIDGIEDDIDSLSGQVATNTSAISDLNDWQIRQDNQISGLSGSVDSAVVSLGSSITAETYQRTAADNYLSGAIRDEAAMRNAAISGLEVTHNEDIAYLGNTKLDISDFETYTASTNQDIVQLKAKEATISGDVRTNTSQIQQLDLKKMDVSGMTTYATKQYTDDGLSRKQNTLTAGEGINISGDVITCTVEFDPTILADYQPVSGMSAYATTGDVQTIESELANKLDSSAYTPTDLTGYATEQYVNTNLANYQPTSGMSAYATTGDVNTAIARIEAAVADKLDASAYTFDADDYYDKDDIDANNQNIAAALNALNTKKLDTSAYTPFNPSVLSAYQPVSGMSAYATTGDVATIETELANKLDTSAYTAFDPSVLAGYQPVSAMSGYYTTDLVDNAERATSAALNELNLRFGSYQPTSGMSGYATTTYVDQQIGNINTILNNING